MNRLSFEICKKLKDAGFTQVSDKIDFNNKLSPVLNKQSLDSAFKLLKDPVFNYKDRIYSYPTIPNLSELIEAFGEGNLLIVRIFKNEIIGWIWECSNGDITFEGITPEEAVSKLWLKLNEERNK